MSALAFLSLAALLLLYWVGPRWRPRGLAGVTRERPLALGHRGVRGGLPENTLAAFRKALAEGLDGLETDVQRTADGTLVLYHDFDIGGVKITDLTLAQLRERFAELTTLDELLSLVAAHPGTLLNVELKTMALDDRGLAASVAQALRAAGLADRVLVSSFNPLALLRLRVRAPELRTAYLWFEGSSSLWFLRTPFPGALLHVDAFHPHHGAASRERVNAWHRRGLMVNVWTVNSAPDVARMLQAGVDGVMADDPRALLVAMGRRSG
jgi:glycerophosphoryl diester phosphodiesterase